MAKIVMPMPPAGSRVAARCGPATRIPATHLASIPPPPLALRIELTPRCNFRCAYCAQQRRPPEAREMRWPLYTRIVGEAVDAGVQELGLAFMGESFLYEWLPDAIEYAKARGIRYAFLSTNGSLATPPRVRACLEAGLDALEFSINCADAAQFEALAQARPGLFDEALAHLAAARRVRDDGRYACALHACSVRFDDAQQERMQGLVDRILPYVDEHFWVPYHGSGGLVARGESPAPCAAPFVLAHVTCDGRLSACGLHVEERWIMADLNEVTLLDGWAAARFAELRDAHLRRELAGTACAGCLAAR